MLAYASLFALLSIARAHMKLNTPVPFSISTLDNSPLLADGSNFPCKGLYGEVDSARSQNVFAAGSFQTLSFIGSAVHGGGSCQLALTSTANPTAATKWQVIHSIEGNCPSNVTGNLEADASGHGAAVFSYQIPDSIPSGDYTLAWTWFNKVGNREMYMNCAPITVTGGGKGDESFPDLFKANIGNGCETVANTDLQFPNPGSSVDLRTETTPPVGTCEQPDSSSPQPASSSSSSSSASSSSVPPAPITTVSSSAIATVTSQPGKNNPQPTSSSVSSSAAVTSSSTSSSSAPVPSGTTGLLSGSCQPEGLYNCLGTSFQRCASGSWSVEINLASGMRCTVGVSDSLDMKAARRSRRSFKSRFNFGRGH